MNRIYQGKVTKVEIPDGADENGRQRWKPLDNWRDALWRHHELFQDAVNYYTLALAAMADRVDGDSIQTKALHNWVTKVRETWTNANRKAVIFDGPQTRLAHILKLNIDESSFDECARRILQNCPASPEVQASAVLRLLSLADETADLSAFAVEKLAWICDPDTARKTDDSAKSANRQASQSFIKRLHSCDDVDLPALAAQFPLSLFVQKTKMACGDEAKKRLNEYFDAASERIPTLASLKADWKSYVAALDEELLVEIAAKRYQGAFPLAVLFKHWPSDSLVVEAFRQATASLAKGKDIECLAQDPLRELRTDKDMPVFDYFTNLAFARDPKIKSRAVWFEFDLAAFVEAIKAPHRYFQDTIKRGAAADRLRQQIAAMKGKGRESSSTDEDGESLPGFEDDTRIELLETIVQKKLAWLAEAEGDEDASGSKEYSIRERTVRGFGEIKRRWQAAGSGGNVTEERLLEILAEEQTEHRDDFGSATLYRELARPENHPVWRDGGTQPWHTEDPLTAWLDYKELQSELQDKERPIRFTPAHPKHSPRFFIFPKKSEAQPKTPNQRAPKPGLLSRHEPGQLSFTAGIILPAEHGLTPTVVRIHYAAPRICRDRLRTGGDLNLYEAPWLQPMMEALGLGKSPDRVNFANCRITLQPAGESDIQIAFPVEVNTKRIRASVVHEALWEKQFNQHPDGDNFYNATLRWPHEKQPAKPCNPWHEQTNSFRCLSTDLGQRDAGAFARLTVRSDDDFANKPTRAIGTTGSKQWRAAVERTGLFRLPGEDAQVWRKKSKRDEQNINDSGKQCDFREELWGERGRPARPWETDDTADLMRLLEALDVNSEGKETLTLLSDDWREALSFPEQNYKLLVAMRRYQSRIARLHRWCWFLKGDDKKHDTAWKEIAECDDTRLVMPELKTRAEKRDPRVVTDLESQLRQRLELAPKLLVRVANRILPLRGRSWHWEQHPTATKQNVLHHLTQNGSSHDSREKPVWLRGQRGLSMERIEQIEELRKRFQSLNQMLRRDVGGKPPIRRDESVPDPCPDLLDKLDNIKKQRVNQTAHMILAEALGLRLAPPPPDKKTLRHEVDQHGVYEKVYDKQGQWIGPVDFIVIEDLSRYRASQGRSPRENSRLMRWCHRAVRDKLKQLCEVFGLPVLETPAAYSSRFCSRSGVPGFRAEEVIAGFTKRGHWAWLADKKDEHAQWLLDLDRQLTEAQAELDRKWLKKKSSALCPKHTLLVPKSGGPVFVPVVDMVQDADLAPAVVQADINAAINLALRAIADPRLWTIHPRLRSHRQSGAKQSKGKRAKLEASNSTPEARLLTREKRKFGEAGKELLLLRAVNAKTDDTRNPNFFADFAGLRSLSEDLAKKNQREHGWLTREWTSSEISGENGTPPLIHSKSFWGCVKAAQWQRINQINLAKLNKWRGHTDTDKTEPVSCETTTESF